MTDLPHVLRLWDAHMRLRDIGEKTRYENLLGFTRMFARLSMDPWEVEDPVLVSEAVLSLYLASISRHGSGYRDAVRVAKAFFGFAEGRLREDNPVEDVRMKKDPVPPAPDITDHNIHRLISAGFRSKDPDRGWGFLLCLATGSRVGALCKLQRKDVHLDSAKIYFRHTKGNRPFESFLSTPALIAAAHLMRRGAERGDGPEDLVIGVGQRMFRKWLAEAAEDAGVGHVNPHLLRHAAITRVARVTDLATIMKYANWADGSQVARYVAVDEDRLRAAAQAVI